MNAMLEPIAPSSGYAPAPGYRYHIELINGQEVEKPLPKKLHILVQRYLILALTRLLPPGYGPMPELDTLTGNRTPDGRREYIVPDLVIARDDASCEDVMLAEPPVWGVEILSPGQRLPQLFQRAERLLEIGCPKVWVIWPEKRRVWAYSSDDLIECRDELTGCCRVTPMRCASLSHSPRCGTRSIPEHWSASEKSEP